LFGHLIFLRFYFGFLIKKEVSQRFADETSKLKTRFIVSLHQRNAKRHYR